MEETDLFGISKCLGKITIYHLLVFSLVLLHIFLTLSFLSPGFPRGGDFSFHYFYLTKTVEFLQNFTTFDALSLWNNYYNLGTPLFYYYQSFPYFFIGFLHLIFPVDLLLLFKLSLIIFYASFPISYYLCARAFGLRPLYSVLFSGYFSFISSGFAYERIGVLSYLSYFQYGSYTYLFSLIFFPLALGYCYKYYYKNREQPQNTEHSFFSQNFFFFILFATITISSHILMGIILIGNILLLAFLKIVFYSSERKETVIKLVISCFFLLLTTSIIWFPALNTKEFYGGLEFASEEYIQGFGFSLVQDIIHGVFFDGQRFPFFTLFFFFGLFVGIYFLFSYYKNSSHKKMLTEELFEEQELEGQECKGQEQASSVFLFIFISFFFSFLFSTGSITQIMAFFHFPSSFFLFPAGKFITVLHFFSGFIFCISIAFLVLISKYFYKYSEGKSPQLYKKIIFLFILLFCLFFLYTSRDIFSYKFEGYSYFESTIDFNKDPYFQEFVAFAQQQPYGVFYIGDKTSTSLIQQMPEIISYHTKKPIILASSGGFHETISTTSALFYVYTMPLLSHINDLFNIQYILFIEGNKTQLALNSNFTKDMNASQKSQYYQEKYSLSLQQNGMPLSLIFSNPEFILYQQNTSGLFDVVHAPILINNSPKEATWIIDTWMTSLLPFYKEFLVIDPDVQHAQEFSTVLSLGKDQNGTQEVIVLKDDDTSPFLEILFFDITSDSTSYDTSLNKKRENSCSSLIEIKEQFVSDGKYSTRFIKNEDFSKDSAYFSNCFLLLKVSMHPDWSVQLIHQDGTESFSELYHLSPNFMAIKINNLDPGEYFLTFSFPFSKLRQSLLFLSLLTLLSLFFICHSAGIFIFRKIQTIKKIHFFFLFFCLFFLFLFGIAKTEGFFTANLPRGGDFIGHYIVLEEVYSSITHFFTDSISLDSNSLAWFSHANAGYPLFYYYQPIGYILFALLYLPFSLSSLSLLSFYKIGIAIAYALLPLSIYFSCRFFGFGKKCALYTAGIFFFVSSKEIYEVIGTFGFEGIFTYGLFTHLLALLLFPVTIGLYYKCLYRTFLLHHLNTEGASLSSNIWRLHSLCIILLALLFYTHILIGALAFFSVAVLFFTLFFFTREKKKLLLIFSVHLLLFFLLITPLLYPAVRTVDYYGGLTLSYETYLTGFGKFFLTDYFHGEFLDHNRALPLITILSIFGFLFFIFSAAKYRSEFLDEAYQKNIPFFFFILALFFISLCFVTGTFSFLQKIPFLSLYPLGKNILLAQFTLLLFAGVAVEKIDSFFHSLANKYNAAHTYNAQRYLFFFYALLLFLAIAFSVPYSRALSFSLTDQHAKILEDLEDLKEQSQNNMRVYIYEDMNKRQTLMPELVVLYSKKPVFNTINGFHETLSVPYLWFYAREIQPTFWLDELFATGYELTFDKQTVRNYTSILSTRDEYTLYAINTSGYFSVIAGDTALFMEHHDAIDFVKDWIKSAMPLYNQHLVLINDYGTVKNISDINATLYNFSNYIIRNPQQKDNYLFYGNPDTGKLLDSLFQWDAKAGEAGQFISTIPQDASTVSQCSHISLLQQTMQKNQYSTVVQVNKNNNKQKYCFLLLKVSMHPDWKVTIQNNGIAHTTGDTGKIYAGEAYERPIAHLSPSFMGVSLDDLAEGEYTITFTFTGKPLLRISLFLFFCLILLFFSYIPSLFSFDKKI